MGQRQEGRPGRGWGGQSSPKAERGSPGDLCTQSNIVGSDCLFHLLKLCYSTCQA